MLLVQQCHVFRHWHTAFVRSMFQRLGHRNLDVEDAMIILHSLAIADGGRRYNAHLPLAKPLNNTSYLVPCGVLAARAHHVNTLSISLVHHITSHHTYNYRGTNDGPLKGPCTLGVGSSAAQRWKRKHKKKSTKKKKTRFPPTVRTFFGRGEPSPVRSISLKLELPPWQPYRYGVVWYGLM